MDKILALALMCGALGNSQATESLYSNGPAVLGTPPPSVLRGSGAPGATETLGLAQQAEAANWMADDFTVTGPGWSVQSLSLFAFQAAASTAFTFTSATWSVVASDVNSGTVAASGTGPATAGGLVGYHVTDKGLDNTDLPTFRVDVDAPYHSLAPGSYRPSWGLTAGSLQLASGPFQPPTADGAAGDARRSDAGQRSILVIDGNPPPRGLGLPFLIQGSVAPELGTYPRKLTGAVAVSGLASRRYAA